MLIIYYYLKNQIHSVLSGNPWQKTNTKEKNKIMITYKLLTMLLPKSDFVNLIYVKMLKQPEYWKKKR